MQNNRTVLAALSAVVLLFTAWGSSSHPASPGSTVVRATSAQAFTVTSTLDGHVTLPQRIHWQATPSIASGQVQEVDFLIDRRLVWVEYNAPYLFGGDDNGANRGYLITTWLSPGPHVFSAKAIDINGRTATNTVNANVAPAPQPPAALRGIWTRIITAQEISKLGGGAGAPPSGRWELAFDKVGA